MEKYIIRGGRELFGEVTVSGAKNAAVAILPATVLVEGSCVIENLPKISDVTVQLEILRKLGADVRLVDDRTVEIDCTKLRTSRATDDELMRKLRASYYFAGALLGRYRSAQVSMPGGCDFGVRPIDQHIKGFEALGASVAVKNGVIHASAENGLVGTHIYFDVVSVGATINTMLAAVRARDLTVLENVAKEPHVVDLANFLNSMGADVKGAGTDIIKIRGVQRLHGGVYTIIPDQIEAGTYMTAVAAAGGDVTIHNVIPKHLECITAKLAEMGVDTEDLDDAVRVSRHGPLQRANLKTMPYPGFPTDMMPQTVSALCFARGTSIVTESVFQSRFRYVDELKRMGAKIRVDGQIAVVEGTGMLTGAPVRACDLRAGATLVVAGLAASGVTEISGVSHIERGYEDFVEKLSALGADIRKIETEELIEIPIAT